MSEYVATSSTEEALDFAAALVAAAVERKIAANPSEATQLCKALARYVEWRYHSEFGLALEMLADMGNKCNGELGSSSQFWSQVSWVARNMQLDAEELSSLNIPSTDG